ncbi:hypothetical protein CTAYLR_009509 [Chrysophaeum taylorii]|uniref:Uncharacterized protein n=1 Tax=Chrysophaeum taylorii TaxID=2483200 RepID=A0AAD7UM55_9STRA|nr:hypothetical protein CTAYLR_009509 [Chrysophaeum taylorii]
MINTPFEVAVLKCAGALAIKMGALHLFTVRTRLMTGDIKTSRKAVFKEDSDMMSKNDFFASFFKTILGAFGPTLCTIERWTGVAGNAAENEPFFVGVALAYANSGIKPPEWATTAVYAFTFFRYVHCLVYLNGDWIPQPFRGLSYSLSLFAMMALAISAVAA